jgi:Pyruvate/2-oxoacid:ferredoxin oxidoreductase delta subunit
MPVMPEHNDELCARCGLCMIACHGGGIVPSGDKYEIIETENCDYCGICEAVCPHFAIRCEYTIVIEEEG